MKDSNTEQLVKYSVVKTCAGNPVCCLCNVLTIEIDSRKSPAAPLRKAGTDVHF